MSIRPLKLVVTVFWVSSEIVRRKLPGPRCARVSQRSVVYPDARPVDEAERGREILADRLEVEFRAERLVGKIEADAIGIVLPGFVRVAAFVIGIGLDDVAAAERRIVAILEIAADNGVSRIPGRISVGEDDAAARHAERRHGQARHRST